MKSASALLAAGFSATALAQVTTTIPEAAGESLASEPIAVSGEFDGEMKRFDRDRKLLTLWRAHLRAPRDALFQLLTKLP